MDKLRTGRQLVLRSHPALAQKGTQAWLQPDPGNSNLASVDSHYPMVLYFTLPQLPRTLPVALGPKRSYAIVIALFGSYFLLVITLGLFVKSG